VYFMQWQRNPTVRLLPGSWIVVGAANYRRGDGSARDVFPLHKQRKGSLHELQRHGPCEMVISRGAAVDVAVHFRPVVSLRSR
jgi:hypothetical protein